MPLLLSHLRLQLGDQSAPAFCLRFRRLLTPFLAKRDPGASDLGVRLSIEPI
jgi:hypothetical protein